MPAPSLPAPVRALRAAGQQVWLDDLSRSLIRSGKLLEAIERWGVTGVTSNPAIVARAVLEDPRYDSSIARCAARGMDAESIALELAVEDVAAAADLLRPVWLESAGEEGWVSIQLSPRLSGDVAGSVAAALAMHERVGRSNVLIKMPAAAGGLEAIEEVLVRGVPVTVTLLLTPAHAASAAEAYVRALERRAAAGDSLDVRSLSALYVSRWDRGRPSAAADPEGTLGIAVADAALGAVRSVFGHDRWVPLAEGGARPQTLLFASTASRDPRLGPAYYVERLAAEGTANTIPPGALEAFLAGGEVRRVLHGDPGDAIGADIEPRGATLQRQAGDGFAEAWDALLADITSRSAPARG